MNKQEPFTGLEIAVIGMAGRFPGAGDIETFLYNLRQGIEAISFFSGAELLEAGIPGDEIDNPAYIKAKQEVEDKEFFDSAFFGYTPGEVRLMDPQIRIFHEGVWTALEDAGYNPETYTGLIGLYAGSAANFSWEAFSLLSQSGQSGSGTAIDDFTALQLRNRDFLTTRISHRLDLKGPAVFLQTACSTSLVAVHMACRGLLLGDCTIALAGGITLTNTKKGGYVYQEGMISSPDGHCRPFDAEARGTVSGEGAAVVVLKKLKKALEDRDNLYAVIKGTAINNDGIRKVGFPAPSVDGQADVIRMAHKFSRVSARSISFIEAHGTGTVLGDPIELGALAQVFGPSRDQYCAVGSLKSNVGHLDAAAGAAGLIKTILALKHRQIYPTLHFRTLNSKIDLRDSPFYINRELKEWKSPGYPRRAGVSSFGIGGTNAHVVLEEAPPPEPSLPGREYHLLILSARTKPALTRMTANLKAFLKKLHPPPAEQEGILADMAYTLQTGRKAFAHRCTLVCQDIPQALQVLSAPAAEEIRTFTATREKKTIVFMFPGQGAQYPDMARDLYRAEPVFREEMDRCFKILSDHSQENLKEILYPGLMSHPSDNSDLSDLSDPSDRSPRSGIDRTEIAQLVIFMVEYGLAKLLTRWGIVPDLMIGHSIGEYTAACLSGVLSLEAALELVVVRGKLMQGLAGGSMLSIPLGEKEVEPLLLKYNREKETLSLAAVNSPQACVVSGPDQAIAALAAELEAGGHNTRRLHTSHAFHSSMMDPVLGEFQAAVAKIAPGKPCIPYISNLTGKAVEPGEVSDPAYWSQHLRRPVRFSRGVESIVEKANVIFIEVGPGKTLSTFIHQHQHAPRRGQLKTVNLLRHPREQVNDQAYLLAKIGELWLYGLSPDWQAFYENQQRWRVSLPTYSFDKIPYPLGADLGKLMSLLKGHWAGKEGIELLGSGIVGRNLEQVIEEEGSLEPIPGICAERPELTTPYIPPVTPTEKKLAVLWQAFFGISRIGVNDDFFQLGGDSLKAMSLAAKIHQVLEVEVPVADFFAFPGIKILARRIDASARKTYTSIAPVEEREYYATSSGQKRLYFQQCLDLGSTAYHLLHILPLPAGIDKTALQNLFMKLIHRHESLRTSFHLIEGEVVQKIHTCEEIELEIEDLLIPGNNKKFCRGSRGTLFQKHPPGLSFDLTCAPLLRIGIIRESTNPPILLIEIHHIIADGISLALLERDLMQFYAGKAPLALRIRCRDYARWQQSLHGSAGIEKQAAYWLKQYEGGIPVLDLPFDYPSPLPGTHTDTTGSVIFRVDSQKLEQVKLWAAKEGITLFFLLLSVYYILLSKYCGQEDIVVGIGAAGRKYTDLEPVVGLFIDVLAMRNYPRKEKSFTRFLNEVKQNALDAFANQDYPFEELVKKLNRHGNTPGTPLFSAAFELLTLDLPEQDDNGAIEPVTGSGNHQGLQTAHYPITIYGAQRQHSVEMALVYDARLFKHSTAEKMAAHYREILNQVAANRQIKLKDIDISARGVLTDREREQLLFEFNRIPAVAGIPGKDPGERLIHQLFETQVEKTPDALALVYRNRQLTYRQLNESANALAYFLRAKGVGPDILVALLLEPSNETIIGIFGVLKAGGAYLPIHHETPNQRVLSLLNDSRVALVLTGSPILRRHSYTSLQGLHRQELKPFRTSPRPQIMDFDGLPFPDRSLVNYEKYNRYIGHNLIQDCISLQATRGCPFHCVYCHKIWPKKHVRRSAENILSEVLLNYNLGIRRFSFVDDILNFDEANSRRFFQLIIQNRLQLHIFCLMRGDMLSKEYIDLMVEAGLVRLGLALETASPRLQKLIRKNLNIEKLRHNLDYLAEKYPHVILELYTMHGFPTETKEEALRTLNFIKETKWLHFPYIFVLTIYPNTEMEKLALDNGIPAEAIDRSLNLGYHELPDTLPFEKDFSIKYQAEFLNDYFLAKERLLHVLPRQMEILTAAEMVQKYNSYLPVEIKSFDHLLEFFDLRREELSVQECLDQKRVFVPHLNRKFQAVFPPKKSAENALRLLLLDLSQNFSTVHGRLDEMIEPPLGLMYLLTYLNRQYKEKINGKIAKALIDFDSFAELNALIEDFQPQVIGIRTLSLYKDFLHETVQKIRHWGVTVPILTGGPYATSSYHTLLQDPNIDLVVLGEGELTLSELVGKIMANNGKLPPEEELKQIAGIVFIPQNERKRGASAREVVVLPSATRGALFEKTAPLDPPQKLFIGVGENLGSVGLSHDLAYMIFTSGSTGLPKGVAVEHRSVSRLVFGLQERIYNRYSQPLHLGLVAPYMFDASVKQIFAALLLGYTLYMIPEYTRVDGPALVQFYKKHCIDVSDGTPTLIHLILETLKQLEPGNAPPLKHLVIGGEPLPKERVQELFDFFKETHLAITNVYGPTEATVDSASFELTRQTLENLDEIPIGKPMPFDFILLLNRENKMVPIGVPGELCIGGGKLARGYLNNPELTSEKFTHNNKSFCGGSRGAGVRRTHPIGECSFAVDVFDTPPAPVTCICHPWQKSAPLVAEGKKFYRSGDLAKWQPDGNICFLGRIDRQVKIRGIRIEPGEIESRLASFSGITEAVVITRRDKQGDDCLCAYIVAEKEIDSSELRRNLAHVMPDYMIPAYFTRLAALPLTVGGKVDWNALPPPGETGLDGETQQLMKPRNPVERQLVEIFQQLLGRKRVGIYENIFTLGADSIKTIQIAYGMKKAGYNLEIRDIFDSPTAAALAPKVSRIQREVDQAVVSGEVPLSPVQEEFFQVYPIDPHHFNHSLLFYSGERLDPAALEAVVIKLQEHHDALRMTYKPGESGQILQWNHGLDYPYWFRVYDYRNRENELSNLEDTLDPPSIFSHKVTQRVTNKIEDTCNQVQASIDLETGPLLKVVLLQLDDGDRLLVVLHHLVVDGLSWRILFEDIGTLYRHYREDPVSQPPPLPPKSDSFKYWAERLREYADSPGFLAEKPYWAQVEAFSLEPIPRDFAEETTLVKDLETLSFSLTEAETERLYTQAAPALGADVWEILITGLGIAFKNAFGLDRVVVALEGHGREDVLTGVDVGRTVGWFTSIYPVVLDFTRQMDIASLIKETGKMLRRVPHKGIGYGILKYLTAEMHKKEIQFRLKPQIGFNYLGQFDTDVERLSLDMAEESPGQTHSLRGTRKYDFTVTAIRAGSCLTISMVYSRKQYKPETTAAVLDHYREMLASIHRQNQGDW